MMRSAILFALAAFLCFGFAAVQAQSNNCFMCQLSVQYVEGYLQQNTTQAKIINQLEAVCDLAPSSFADQCDAFVTSNVPSIINYLVKTEDPTTACTQLSLCSSSFLAANN